MSKTLMRIPYTGPLPPAIVIPPSATTIPGAIVALSNFLLAARTHSSSASITSPKHQTVLLTGAGISVASGLADYRGTDGTYTQNKSYRPIYFHEFVASHEARKRYWARSFLGWRGLNKSHPNTTHHAIADLARLNLISSVITQNVDSFHRIAHSDLRTIELHGFLRSLVCLSCRQLYPRDEFQTQLNNLNPIWKDFLAELQKSGALDTENLEERRKKGYRTNPDGDADVPGAPYTTFRYPPCPECLKRAPLLNDGSMGTVAVDDDGAWSPRSDSGVLKPNVIMFGESIPNDTKVAAEEAITEASRVLIVGSSLATYSAWRLVKQALESGKGIGVLNLGGVRKEADFFPERDMEWRDDGRGRVRVDAKCEDVLPGVVERCKEMIQKQG